MIKKLLFLTVLASALFFSTGYASEKLITVLTKEPSTPNWYTKCITFAQKNTKLHIKTTQCTNIFGKKTYSGEVIIGDYQQKLVGHDDIKKSFEIVEKRYLETKKTEQVVSKLRNKIEIFCSSFLEHQLTLPQKEQDAFIAGLANNDYKKRLLMCLRHHNNQLDTVMDPIFWTVFRT